MTTSCKSCSAPFTYFYSESTGTADSCYHLSNNDGGQNSGFTYCSGLSALCYLATPDTLGEMNYFRSALNGDTWLSGSRPGGPGPGGVYTWQPSGTGITLNWCDCGGGDDYLIFKNGNCGGGSICER